MFVKQFIILALIFIICISTDTIHGDTIPHNNHIIELIPQAGFLGSGPYLGGKIAFNYTYLSFSLSGGGASGKLGTFIPIIASCTIKLGINKAVQPYITLGGGLLWAVPSQSVAVNNIREPGVCFGGGLRLFSDKVVSLTVEMTQYITMIDNRIGLEEVLLFQGNFIGAVIKF